MSRNDKRIMDQQDLQDAVAQKVTETTASDVLGRTGGVQEVDPSTLSRTDRVEEEAVERRGPRTGSFGGEVLC